MIEGSASSVTLEKRKRVLLGTGFNRGSHDRMRDGFGSEPASKRHRLIFLGIAVLLCVVRALTCLHADLPLVSRSSLVVVFLSAVTVADLTRAYLIFVHAPLSRRFDLLCLASTYLFSSTIAIGQLVVFPGIVTASGLFGAKT